MKNYEIRGAVISDQANITNLASGIGIQITSSQILRAIHDNSSHITCLILDDILAGFAMTGNFVLDEVSLLYLCVGLKHRRLGYGRNLFLENIEFWRKKRIRKCLLELKVSNDRARIFYETLGFKVDGVRPNYYPVNMMGVREDALLMSWRLPEKLECSGG